MSKGLFVTFEGVDGSGKSTQARLLAEYLRAKGIEIVETREPGGSIGAEEIRRLLVEGEAGRWSPETEILLFNAARRDHLEKTIEPALAANKTVICDRFADSTRVYQGAARAELREMVDRLHSLMIGCEPDLTFVIDIDPELALGRGLARNSGEDRFESLGLGFQQVLRAGFLQLAADFPQRFIVVNGQRPVAEVAADIATHMAKRLS